LLIGSSEQESAGVPSRNDDTLLPVKATCLAKRKETFDFLIHTANSLHLAILVDRTRDSRRLLLIGSSEQESAGVPRRQHWAQIPQAMPYGSGYNTRYRLTANLLTDTNPVHMDAANIDLKAFTERFYKKICGGELASVLETLLYLRKETNVT
jgi:hypothetical protein